MGQYARERRNRYQYAYELASVVLRQAQVDGIRLSTDGDDLVLESATPFPSAVLCLIRRHKAGIYATLPKKDSWIGKRCESAEGWRHFVEECAFVIEYSYGLTRAEAEAEAYKIGVDHWAYLNSEISPKVHDLCYPEWWRTRQAAARAALFAMGIEPPADTEPKSESSIGRTTDPSAGA